MKRKIALLLAFAMVLSILPMNMMSVSAFFPGAVLGGGTRTGMIAEPAGPARNVRHWGSGVAVGRQWIVNWMTPPNNPLSSPIAAAPQGNLRHILVDAAYFGGRQTPDTAAWLTMHIHNVERWLGWPPGTSPGWFNWGWSPALSVWTTLPGNVAGGVSQFDTTTPPPYAHATVPDPPPANWYAGATDAAMADSIREHILHGTTGDAADRFVSFVVNMINYEDGDVPESLLHLVTSVRILGGSIALLTMHRAMHNVGLMAS